MQKNNFLTIWQTVTGPRVKIGGGGVEGNKCIKNRKEENGDWNGFQERRKRKKEEEMFVMTVVAC